MQVIWKRGNSTVAEVQAEMRPALAYTTVQTVLNILERKGKLNRELEGGHLYIGESKRGKSIWAEPWRHDRSYVWRFE